MEKITTTIPRKPGDCDFDIEEICKDIEFHNSVGNLLKSWTIGQNTIVLQYE